MSGRTAFSFIAPSSGATLDTPYSFSWNGSSFVCPGGQCTASWTMPDACSQAALYWTGPEGRPDHNLDFTFTSKAAGYINSVQSSDLDLTNKNFAYHMTVYCADVSTSAQGFGNADSGNFLVALNVWNYGTGQPVAGSSSSVTQSGSSATLTASGSSSTGSTGSASAAMSSTSSMHSTTSSTSTRMTSSMTSTSSRASGTVTPSSAANTASESIGGRSRKALVGTALLGTALMVLRGFM